ncbi:hypothetical protein SpAn4DRAFT_4468 [Sporomusa ovata]|uniref:Uncharacterized protein n=1 Tax=Sporomusa ovata TaxID=2378 RepID=A0A0U1L883_9FIRM|nr:hypothetical protein SpAn4DRAFT_4468 [Sporomusa ovata]
MPKAVITFIADYSKCESLEDQTPFIIIANLIFISLMFLV